MSEKFTINSDKSKAEFIQAVSDLYDQKKYLTIEVKTRKPRTNQQRKSIEVYCSEMAGFLNDRGIDYVQWEEYKKAKGVETPWSQELFKGVFRDYAAALFPDIVNKKGVASTSRLSSKQVTEAYELVNMRISTIFGCGTLWPSEGDR